MNWADLSNGGFEALSGVVSLLNVRRLLRDRNLQGVSVWPAAFFTAWGAYNFFFYSHLGLWWSFAGGMLITGVNTVWLALAWRFRNRPRTPESVFAFSTYNDPNICADCGRRWSDPPMLGCMCYGAHQQ